MRKDERTDGQAERQMDMTEVIQTLFATIRTSPKSLNTDSRASCLMTQVHHICVHEQWLHHHPHVGCITYSY
jgi:hypothetical protein